jgi:hypothetical protein
MRLDFPGLFPGGFRHLSTLDQPILIGNQQVAGSIPAESNCPGFVREHVPIRPNQTQGRISKQPDFFGSGWVLLVPVAPFGRFVISRSPVRFRRVAFVNQLVTLPTFSSVCPSVCHSPPRGIRTTRSRCDGMLRNLVASHGSCSVRTQRTLRHVFPVPSRTKISSRSSTLNRETRLLA